MSIEIINAQEAPQGFYAVLKSSFPKDQGNLCQFCDFREICKTDDWDTQNSNNRCMSYPIISFKTGKTIERKDGCSVVFKRLQP